MVLRNIILSLIVLGVAFAGSKLIIAHKPTASMKSQSNTGALVEAVSFGRAAQDAIIIGQGIVSPAEQVNLIAQVSGVVSKLHPELSAGGRVKRGERLLQIDPTDYSLAVSEARARVKIAEQEVSLEAGRRIAAREEWEIMRRRGGSEVSEDAKRRALRQPQELIAQNNLKIARNALRRAQVGYGRTTLKAPFNGVILSESVDKGQLVGPGAPVLTLAGTDVFWVTASIPTSELGWIDFPKMSAKRRASRKSRRVSKRTPKGQLGSRAIVRYDVGAEVIEREGRVIRQLTQVETTGRMARVVIEVRDPLDVEDDASPLLLGAQVEVKVIGKPLKDVIEIPRSALHEDHIWVFSPEPARGQGELSMKPQDGVRSPSASAQGRTLLLGKLEVRPVKVLRRRADSVLIREGLAEDELVITSRLPTAVPGMLLRLAR